MELHTIDTAIRARVDRQLASFEKLWAGGTEQEIFIELLFCLCTPQSKARMAEKAVNMMRVRGLLFKAEHDQLVPITSIVRFKNQKAKHIIAAQQQFIRDGVPFLKSHLQALQTPSAMREWLAANVNGIGWKEASHFLRNIGLGQNFAILDRHILRNMAAYKVIETDEVNVATGPNYLAVEEKLLKWAEKLGIPAARLDYVLWYKEAEDVFK